MAILDRMRHELRAADREAAQAERVQAEAMAQAYAATVRALSNAISARDAYMGRHAERVTAYGLRLARAVDQSLCDDPQVEFGFVLHDIGKLAVPDSVLNKRGPLNPREWRLIRRHPEIGHHILASIDFLERARSVVLYHHERWDGRGYPQHVKGEDIPLEARVFAVADALDAITSDRPYRRAVSFAEARDELRRAAGSQFDPAVIDALDSVSDEELEAIRRETADTPL